MDNGGKRLPSLDGITLDQIAQGLDGDHFTCLDLTRAYTRRIQEVNREYKAVLEINPEAEAIAKSLDEEMEVTGRRGPLHGVPIIVQDSIMADGMNCSSGSVAFFGARAAKEATVVSRLRKAGAVILASANLSEFNNFRTSGVEQMNGWSARGGASRGVFHPNQTPGGSSSGCGSATRLGLAFASLGAETCGSITSPALSSATVGLKPTPGLTPRDAVVSISQTLDTIGPMTRTVKDAAVLLTAIAGSSDEKHPAMHRCPFPPARVPNYVAACGKAYRPRLDGLRIGVPRAARTDQSFIEALGNSFDDMLALMRDLGAEVVDNVKMDMWSQVDFGAEYREVAAVTVEFKDTFAKFCASLTVNPNNIQSAEDLVAYMRATPDEKVEEHNIDRIVMAAKSPAIDDPAYQEAWRRLVRHAGPEGVLGMMDKYRLDALVWDEAFSDDMLYLPLTVAGMPIISIPTGFFHDGTPIRTDKQKRLSRAAGLPFRVLLSTRPFKEELLVRIGHAVEQSWTRQGYAEPYMEPKTELRDVIEKK